MTGSHRDVFLNSPVNAILDGADEVRAPPARDAGRRTTPFPLFGELRQRGLTDYVIWPLQFTRGQRHVLSFAADRAGRLFGPTTSACSPTCCQPSRW